MKKLLIIIPIIFLISCSGKMINDRFDPTLFSPYNNTPTVEETEVEILFGSRSHDSKGVVEKITPKKKESSRR